MPAWVGANGESWFVGAQAQVAPSSIPARGHSRPAETDISRPRAIHGASWAILAHA